MDNITMGIDILLMNEMSDQATLNPKFVRGLLDYALDRYSTHEHLISKMEYQKGYKPYNAKYTVRVEQSVKEQLTELANNLDVTLVDLTSYLTDFYYEGYKGELNGG